MQKAQKLQQKHERTKHYKRALDTQARIHHTELTVRLDILQMMAFALFSLLLTSDNMSRVGYIEYIFFSDNI